MVTDLTRFQLPNIESMIVDLEEVKKFQVAVRQHLIKGQDYGVIPGTDKPTLLKPGAEKIDKILKLADTYEELTAIEDWIKPLFFYKIKCRLVLIGTDIVVSEGMGSCSSMEAKYRYRWVSERDLPHGIDKATLPHQERHAASGGHWTVYRVENEDIYTQANTILKMAKKRAHIDASLSAGRLSDVFTQDIEDITPEYTVDKDEEKENPSEHWCEKHKTKFFKRGKMKNYAHPIEGTDPEEWCNEPIEAKVKAQKPTAPPPTEPDVKSETPEQEKEPIDKETNTLIDMDWLNESCKKLNWKEATIISYLSTKFHIPKAESLDLMIAQITKEDAKSFTKEIQDRLEMI